MGTKTTTPSHRSHATVPMVVMAAVMVIFILSNSRAEARSLPNPYSSTHLSAEWHAWKWLHGKDYNSQREELSRHVVWQANKKYIETHNRLNETFGFTLEMNEFSDLTEEEYQMQYSCVKYTSSYEDYTQFTTPIYKPASNLTLPEMVDWHTKGAVSSVSKQGECCSSYAFSAVGSIEGAEALASSAKVVALSAQNILDCSSPYGNHGCLKGGMERSFQYAIDEGGLDTETSYPYEGVQRKCRFKKSHMQAAFRGFERVRSGDESSLQSAVALEGPVAVAVDAKHNTFRFYRRGVYDEPNCSTHKLTHAMLIVGYGQYYGKDFWLLKNSWGKSWGQKGYVMMARNKYNQCGIASRALFPML